jgi:two-component system, NarL family, sensor kinase
MSLTMRTYAYIAFVFTLLLPATSQAQQRAADSLRAQMRIATADTTRVAVYYSYGSLLETAQPDSAMWYFNKARDLARKTNDLRGQAAYASHAIVVLNNQGKFREALALSKEALQMFETVGKPKELGVAYANVGSEWHYLSDFETAADYYLKALKIAEETNDRRLQRIMTNNLASIFINLEQFEKGKAYAERSLVVALEMKNDYAISSSTFNIATAELSLKQYDKALAHYQSIEAIGLRTDDYIVILDGWLGQGDTYGELKKVPLAEKYYQQVITLSTERDAPEYEMYAYMGLSKLYFQIRRYPAAERNVVKGIALARRLGSNYELKDLYLRASDLEAETGDFTSALKYRKEFEQLNDSIVGEKSRSNITMLEARYESEKKEATIRQLETDQQIQQLTIRQQNTLNYVLVGIALALLIISLLAYRNYRQKQRLQQQRIQELETEKQLLATEAILKGEEQERARLAKDLHDGLGGMLSGTKFSLHAMKASLPMTPENQQAFERSIDMLDSSIQEMRRVAHNMMPEALLRFGLDTALRDFCQSINQSGAISISYQSIGLGEAALEQSVSIAVYRIVQELINNTLKHAGAKTAIVQVTLADGNLSITVEDDGKGFDVARLKRSPGIGWSNLRHRVEFLQATLDIHSAPGEGTSVLIEIEL